MEFYFPLQWQFSNLSYFGPPLYPLDMQVCTHSLHMHVAMYTRKFQNGNMVTADGGLSLVLGVDQAGWGERGALMHPL